MLVLKKHKLYNPENCKKVLQNPQEFYSKYKSLVQHNICNLTNLQNMIDGAAPPLPPRERNSKKAVIAPFIYWKDSGKEAAKNLKPGEFLIRESEQPGKLTVTYRGDDRRLASLRIGYTQGRWKLLNSQSNQSTEPVSILDISNPKSHAIFAELLTEISARLPDCKMVIPTEKEAGLLNVYSDYYSSKTSVDAYRVLHSGLEQYFSSSYNLSGQEKAKSDLADKHDELGQKLDMKGYGELLDFQIKGFANKEQNSKQLSDMIQTLVNKSGKMAAMSSLNIS
jgi:hypothetical protein